MIIPPLKGVVGHKWRVLLAMQPGKHQDESAASEDKISHINVKHIQEGQDELHTS